MSHVWYEALKGLLGQGNPPEFAPDTQKISSVLITVGWNRESSQHEILMMKRPESAANHRGQICFPGGFRESTDETILGTALREFREEVGTKPEHIEVLGTLQTVQTRFGVLIVPWVARLDLPYAFQINPSEVDRLLFLPVSRLLEEGLKPVTATVDGLRVSSLGIMVDGELVWGATAKMLEELRERFLRLPDWKESLRTG